MQYPDPAQYNPDPAYIRSLFEKAGVGQREFAKLFNLNERSVRRYVKPDTPYPAPYLVQWALETLADAKEKTECE